MPPSWRLALNSLSRRRVRTALMGGAVALAASLVVAVSCAIGSAQASLEQSLKRFLGAADARLIHPGGARFDAEFLRTVRSWPEVEQATGRVDATITLIRSDGRRNPETGRPYRATPRAVGLDFQIEPAFRTVDLESGAWPTEPDEVVLDPMTAEALDAAIGDRIEVQRFGDPIPLRIAAIYTRPDLGALQRPRIFMDRAILGEASGVGDRLTAIYIILPDDLEVTDFCAAHADELPAPLSLEPAELVRAGFDKRVRASRIGLSIGSAMAFLCAAFIIVTGLTTAVTEQRRELALLRSIGASRPQVFMSRIGVGALLGAAGAFVGIPLGIGLAGTLVAWYGEYLQAGLVLHREGILLAGIGSIGSGLIGALYPAIAASRVPPLVSLAIRAQPVRLRSIVICGIVAVLLVAIQVSTIAIEDVEARFWRYMLLGLPCLFGAAFLFAVPLHRTLTAIVHPVLALALRLPRRLLADMGSTTPFRHGLTAGTLMLGVAILVDAWASGVAIQRDWLNEIRFADGFAFSAAGLDEEQREAITELPFVESTCTIGRMPLTIVGQQVFGISDLSPNSAIGIMFDPVEFFRVNAVDWILGDPEVGIPKLQRGEGILVAERFLTAKGMGAGDMLTLGVGRHERTFEIVGVVSAAGLDIATTMFGISSQYTEFSISCVFIDRTVARDVFGSEEVHILQVELSDSITDEEAETAIAEAAPGVVFRSGRGIVESIREIAETSLAVQSTIALAALILASLAAANVIAAGIHARRFEYGVLRAIGGRRSIIVRLVLGEAATLALTGAVLGTILGFHLARIDSSFMNELAGLPVGIAVPIGPIAVGWCVQFVITMLAALPPAIAFVRKAPATMV